MKKILFSLLLFSGTMTSLGAHAAFSSVSCGGLTGSGGCGSCFEQSSPIYTCNPYQSSCNKEMINSMSDISTNVSGGGKFMRQEYPGTIAMSRVQNTTSWTAQNASSQMFELTPEFFTPAPAVGQKGYQLAASGYYGHYLPVGTSVKWTQLKSNGWIRPDLAQAGTSRTSPAYKVTFTPRLYTDATNYIDHAQCVFFYVRFCGDGTVDTDRGEQCDDGNMNSGDGCSNICETEVPVVPVCSNLTVTPTSVVNGGSVTYTCTGTNVTSYSIIARNTNGNIIASSTSASGGLILPATPAGTYNIACYVNGQVSTPASCQKTVTNTVPPEPICTNLTVTPTSVVNGGNVTYTCTGENVSSWSVQFSRPNGTIFQTLTTATGSVTIPSTPTDIYTAKCFINGQTTTPAACQKTVENSTNPQPKIDIDKRDANPADLDGSIGNDTQTVTSGSAAVFKIRVTNNGTEDLRNLVLSDAVAPSCAGNVTLPSTYPGTWSNFAQGGSGNHSDGLLQVGEWFEYTCNRGNTTAPYTNSATVTGTGVTSGIPVNATDTTPVLIPSTNPQPKIDIDKRDANPADLDGSIGNDTQTVTSGSAAVFKIRVTNNGTEDLRNLVLSDAVAPSCAGNVTLPSTYPGTWSNFAQGGSGNHSDGLLQVGEWFEYTCNRGNTTAPYTNSATVTGTGVTSGIPVNATDTTPVLIPSTTTPTPLIQVIKDDNDNHDDRQFLQNGAAATFTIVVKNPGTEPLENVVLNDPYAPECNRNSAQTQAMIVNVGNRDNRLDPGESFSYLCTRNNVDQSTFPNNENRICVDGRGSTSGIPVNSCDITRVEFGANICQDMQVTQTGNQANVVCSPDGNYRLFVLDGSTVLNTYQNNNGQFNFTVPDGTYKIACLKDGEQSFQPSCQKMITVSPKSNYCTLSSSAQYGGAPLRTKLDCRSNTYEQCHIRILKDGKPWGNVADCYADMVFEERGVYDATCVLDGQENQSCSTRVQVDVMTTIPTGPFLPLIIIIAMSSAGYMAYRRRKTA